MKLSDYKIISIPVMLSAMITGIAWTIWKVKITRIRKLRAGKCFDAIIVSYDSVPMKYGSNHFANFIYSYNGIEYKGRSRYGFTRQRFFIGERMQVCGPDPMNPKEMDISNFLQPSSLSSLYFLSVLFSGVTIFFLSLYFYYLIIK